MADVATPPAPAEVAAKAPASDPKPSTSKKAAGGAKKSASRKTAALPEHPKYSVMIASAISSLKERGGSSRQAILKYINGKYNLGPETAKINSRLKIALKAGVKTGNLKQSKGTGAAGSFRLGERKRTVDKVDPKRAKKAKKPKAAAKKPTKKSTPKKGAPGRKSAKSPAKKTGKKTLKVKSPAKKVAKKLKASSKMKPKAKSPVKRTPAKPRKPKTAAKPLK